MDTIKILKKVNSIFKDVLDDKKITINAETTAADVPEWDSLTHIQLVVAIEKFFKIRFTSSELLRFKNVGDMVLAIESKLK